MLFCSQEFLTFFSLIFVVYWALPWRRARVWLILGASLYFYARWNKWLAALICISTLIDYGIARGMDGSSIPWRRKLLLAVSLASNLGLLVYFKYANFFLHSLEEALHAAGADVSLPVLRVILPIGISFYTFEAINYTVDVYRRAIRAERSLPDFMVFILFFPHLVAGPIVRARDFLPQVKRAKHWSWVRMELGARYFLLGLFKKLAIADRVALLVDPVFAAPADYSTGTTWLAVLAYAIQIYCDFSGYTDMALGAAHLLGYKLAKNFNVPYLAANPSEFWRRWHISLSSWLRDYLFIPLGGSRGSACPRCCRLLTQRNLLITMTLGGLWHGANWTFVVWGMLHGGLLTVHRSFRDISERQPWLRRGLESLPGTVARIGTTFLFVCLGWVFFRATTLATAMTIVGQLFSPHKGEGPPVLAGNFFLLAAMVIICHLLTIRNLWNRLVPRLPAPVLGMGYAVALVLALALAPSTDKAFIYFQF
jgi:alginate O-acetyltransferase complex protein AlgI